jgi:hypothetical protein
VPSALCSWRTGHASLESLVKHDAAAEKGVEYRSSSECGKGSTAFPGIPQQKETIAAEANPREASSRSMAMLLELKEIPFKGSSGSVGLNRAARVSHDQQQISNTFHWV